MGPSEHEHGQTLLASSSGGEGRLKGVGLWYQVREERTVIFPLRPCPIGFLCPGLTGHF